MCYVRGCVVLLLAGYQSKDRIDFKYFDEIDNPLEYELMSHP